MVVCYYHSKHLPVDYEPIPDQTFNQKSPSEDSDYEDDIDIEGPTHNKDYLSQWQEHHPHYIGIHAIGPIEEEVVEEDVDVTQDRWGAPITSSGWDGEPSSNVQDASLDASHDDNDEIDPDQDDYESEVADEVDDIDEDDDDDDNDGKLLTLWFFSKNFFSFHIM